MTTNIDFTELIIIILILIIFCAQIIQIRLATKTIHLIKKEKLAELESKSKVAVGLDTEVKVEEQIPKNQRLEDELQDEVIITVFLKMFTVRNSVHKQISNIHVKSIENAPKQVSIDEQLLLQSFSKTRLDLINMYWDLFNNYIQTYWISKNGGLKTVFSGDIDKKTGEVGKMLSGSEQLLVKLDKIIEEFQKN